VNTNFSLIQHHGYSLRDVEGMIPYEREIYIGMLARYLEKTKKEIENLKNRR
jgi:hypothetical protein